jgi:hypothetical protein
VRTGLVTQGSSMLGVQGRGDGGSVQPCQSRGAS